MAEGSGEQISHQQRLRAEHKTEAKKEQDKMTLQTPEMSQADSLAQNQNFSYQSAHWKALLLVACPHASVCSIKGTQLRAL